MPYWDVLRIKVPLLGEASDEDVEKLCSFLGL